MAGKGTSFKVVQILKDQSLGFGAYGQVCKAKCDDLICAAKIIHPTLNVRHQGLPRQEHRLPIERFDRECELMNAMKHPNIVQYLGLYHDRGTGLPVLLMELMDDNLTNYLETSPQPIPYHVQVNISHDVSMALSYLHNNDIIHRDLSGKNVLLRMGNILAKVTDFGMAKLGELVPHYSNTMCPGTDVYMPPEAVQEQPKYDKKIDCFSFGVVVLQILTRQFPKPRNRQQRVEGNHPGYPGGRIMVCVPETVRRQEHIGLVSPGHPLLFIAQDCLRDSDGERPTAQQICERVAILKQTSAYSESSAAKKKVGSDQVQGLQQIMRSQTIRLEEREAEIRQLMLQNQEKDRELHQLREQLEHAMQNYQVINMKDKMIDANELEIERLKQDVLNLQQEVLQLQQFIQHKDQRIRHDYKIAQQKVEEITERDREIQQLRIELQRATLRGGENEKNLKDMKDRPEIDRREQHEHDIVKVAPVIKHGRNIAAGIGHKEVELQKEIPKLSARAVLKPVDQTKMTWREGKRTQRGMTRVCDAVVSTNDNVVYILPYAKTDTTVCKFEIATSLWSSLKNFPYSKCSLALIKDILIVIGGCSGLSVYSNKLYSYIGEGEEGKWSTSFPPMPTERGNTCALVIKENLLVAGGENGRGPLAVVEVMNIETQEWSTVAPLPEPLLNASMASCGVGGDIYMLGGKNQTNQSNKCVYTCTLCSLLMKSDDQQIVWRKISDSPLSDSTCVSLHGRLITIGGTDVGNRPTKDVFMYDQVAKSWKSVGQMLNDRHSCVAAVLPDNQVMVVGGWNGSHSKTDSVEFGIAE